MAGELLIRAGTLVDGTGGAPRRNVAIWVRDGTIQAVQDAAVPIPGVAPAAEIVDAPGQTLLPGLIDTHVHLVFSAGTYPLGDYLAEDDQRLLLRATSHAQRVLRAGTTTVRDAGGRQGIVIAVRNAIRDGLMPGPRIVATAMPVTTTAGHCYWLGLEADSADDVRKAARALHRLGADYYKVMATGGGMTPGSEPLYAQYTVEQLSALIAEAQRLGKTVAAHCHGTAGIRNAVAAGVTTLEHCSWYGYDRTDFDEAVAEEIVRKGIFVTPTMIATLGHNPDPATLTQTGKRLRSQLPTRIAAWRRQAELGTKITAGTDGIGPTQTFDCLVRNLELMVEHLGITPMQAIQAATSRSAESMHLDHEIGTVTPGKRADLLVVDGDPIANLGALRNVRRVVRDGRTVVLDGRLC